MILTITTEYRELAVASSNEMLAHDSRRILGRYVEAAQHAYQAGISRMRMAQLSHTSGDSLQAANDWLAATACFHLANAPDKMQEALAHLRELESEGKLPSERADILNTIAEYNQQLVELEKRHQ